MPPPRAEKHRGLGARPMTPADVTKNVNNLRWREPKDYNLYLIADGTTRMRCPAHAPSAAAAGGGPLHASFRDSLHFSPHPHPVPATSPPPALQATWNIIAEPTSVAFARPQRLCWPFRCPFGVSVPQSSSLPPTHTLPPPPLAPPRLRAQYLNCPVVALRVCFVSFTLRASPRVK